MKLLKSRFVRIASIILLSLQIILIPPVIKAQSLESVNDEPGAGGSSQSSVEEGSSNSTLFILFGVAVAAILFYKFVLSEDDAEEENIPESDSTDVSQSELLNSVSAETKPAEFNYQSKVFQE